MLQLLWDVEASIIANIVFYYNFRCRKNERNPSKNKLRVHILGWNLHETAVCTMTHCTSVLECDFFFVPTWAHSLILISSLAERPWSCATINNHDRVEQPESYNNCNWSQIIVGVGKLADWLTASPSEVIVYAIITVAAAQSNPNYPRCHDIGTWF